MTLKVDEVDVDCDKFPFPSCDMLTCVAPPPKVVPLIVNGSVIQIEPDVEARFS